MCTVSWRTGSSGYEVLFNRDELRSRTEAEAPSRQSATRSDANRGRMSYLAPTDPDGGGTWILVNQDGLTICLTNGYRPGDGEQRSDWRSRGLLVVDLAQSRSYEEVAHQAALLVREHRYRSFTLLAFAPGEQPRGWNWGNGGSGLRLFEPTVPLSSSSLDALGAGDLRRSLYAHLPAEPRADDLLALHQSHQGGPRSLTPCMHRPEARTVSLTRVRVAPESITMQYAPGSPCRTQLGEPLVLEHAAA